MPSTSLPPSTDNDYTFGADAPSTSRAKKKKKTKSAAVIDLDSKKEVASADNVAAEPPIRQTPMSSAAREHEVDPVKEELPLDKSPECDLSKDSVDDGSSSDGPVEKSALHDAGPLEPAEPHIVTTPAGPPQPIVQEQSQSILPPLPDHPSPLVHHEALRPPAVPEPTLQDYLNDPTAASPTSLRPPAVPEPTLQDHLHDSTAASPTKAHMNHFVRHETERRPLDPSPDRRHPSLQMPSLKPSPHMTSVKMQDPPSQPLPQPHTPRHADWRYPASDHPPAFVPAARLDVCTTLSNGRYLSNNVVLLGNEGGLDVCQISRQREIVARLEGLRGAVLDAKILPGPLSRHDPLQHLRPLVACVVHGPVVDQNAPPISLSSISAYQTTVEIYSLKMSSYLQTLFSSAPVKFDPSTAIRPPPPDSYIALAASGRFLTMALGLSGEVMVFESVKPDSDDGNFRCVAKFWTVCRSRPVPVQEPPLAPDQKIHRNLPNVPIFSLSGRWLAVVPPLLSSSQKSADGKLHSDTSLDPSVTAFVSPPPPQVDCEVDAPADGGIFNRVTKQATQEVVKGAQWVGEQGLGILKSYWRRASHPSGEDAVRSATSHTHGPSSPEDAFPPTHGHNTRREPAIKPALVSIIDLLRCIPGHRDDTSAPSRARPVTFSLPDGCSYLSFDPEGLSLSATNQLGDASSIWDVSRIMDHASATRTICRLARFPRMSPSCVVDVQWTSQGRRIGILTQKGTLHLHEVPGRESDAFRRRRSSLLLDTNLAPSNTSASPQSPPSNGGWVSNVVSTLQTVQHRIQDPDAGGIVDSTRKKLGEASLAARHAGGRAVRNGYTSAIGGAQTLRHAQKNKIRLKTPVVQPGCVRWLAGKGEGLVAVIDDGTIGTFAVKTNFYNNGRRVAVSLDAGKKVLDQPLDISTSGSIPPSLLGRLDPTGPFASCARAGVHGFWTLGAGEKAVRLAARGRRASTIRASDVVFDKETSPQSMPFHRHKQVDLSCFDGDDESTRQALGCGRGQFENSARDGGAGTWVFGLGLPSSTRINVIQSRSSPDTDADGLEDDTGVADDGFSLRDGSPLNKPSIRDEK